MPTYHSKCQKCGKVHAYTARISNYNTEMPECCGHKTARHFPQGTTPIFSTAVTRFEPYQCPVTDRVVTTARQKKYIEDSNDLVIKEKGMFKPRKKPEPVPELPDVLKPELEKELAKVNG